MNSDVKTFAISPRANSNDPDARTDCGSSRTAGVGTKRDALTGNLHEPTYGPQLGSALDRLRSLVVEGLQHGFFDCAITCETVTGGKRRLVIRAGKSHQYTIPLDELPR